MSLFRKVAFCLFVTAIALPVSIVAALVLVVLCWVDIMEGHGKNDSYCP